MSESVVLGVIGGSGLYQMEGADTVTEHALDTPYGKPSDAIVEAVAQAASKMNRQQKMNARRGIGGPKLSQNEIQKRAAKATKKKVRARVLLPVTNISPVDVL